MDFLIIKELQRMKRSKETTNFDILKNNLYIAESDDARTENLMETIKGASYVLFYDAGFKKEASKMAEFVWRNPVKSRIEMTQSQESWISKIKEIYF